MQRRKPELTPMRRKAGIGGLRTDAAAREKYRILGENVAKLRTELLKEQLATFCSELEEFARKHKNDIRKNPTFRAQFHGMCAKVGVDPSASNKGFWTELLGMERCGSPNHMRLSHTLYVSFWDRGSPNYS